MSLLMLVNNDNRMVDLSVDDMAKYCLGKAINIQKYTSNANMDILNISSSISDLLDEVVEALLNPELPKRASIDELKEIIIKRDHLLGIILASILNNNTKKSNFKVHGYYMSIAIDLFFIINNG